MDKNRKLFVIDGLDGCGKSTQLPLVANALANAGIANRVISFPDYDSPSSSLVKLYLAGAFGSDADAVNPFAVSSFYAVDRFAAFQQHWRTDWEAGTAILSGRYVSSNAMYQMTKLPQSAWDAYLDWLSDYEYNKLCLPRPTRVVFLDMPLSEAQALLSARYAGTAQTKDIHEANFAFMERCHTAAHYAAKREGWTVLSCMSGDQLCDKATMTERITAALLAE